MKENKLSCNRYSKTKNVSGFRKDKNEYIKCKKRPRWEKNPSDAKKPFIPWLQSMFMEKYTTARTERHYNKKIRVLNNYK